MAKTHRQGVVARPDRIFPVIPFRTVQHRQADAPAVFAVGEIDAWQIDGVVGRRVRQAKVEILGWIFNARRTGEKRILAAEEKRFGMIDPILPPALVERNPRPGHLNTRPFLLAQTVNLLEDLDKVVAKRCRDGGHIAGVPGKIIGDPDPGKQRTAVEDLGGDLPHRLAQAEKLRFPHPALGIGHRQDRPGGLGILADLPAGGHTHLDGAGVQYQPIGLLADRHRRRSGRRSRRSRCHRAQIERTAAAARQIGEETQGRHRRAIRRPDIGDLERDRLAIRIGQAPAFRRGKRRLEHHPVVQQRARPPEMRMLDPFHQFQAQTPVRPQLMHIRVGTCRPSHLGAARQREKHPGGKQ